MKTETDWFNSHHISVSCFQTVITSVVTDN